MQKTKGGKNIKKFIILFFIAGVMLSVFVSSVWADENTVIFALDKNSYSIGDNVVAMDDFPSYIKNNRVFLPLRYAADAIGIKAENVLWDGPSKTVTLIKDGITARFRLNSKVLFVNNNIQFMDVVPEFRNGRVMLSVNWLARVFNLDVKFDLAGRSVVIKDCNKNTINQVSAIGAAQEAITKEYRWYDKQINQWTWQVSIPEKIYQHYSSQPRLAYDSSIGYVPYAIEKENCKLLKKLTEAIIEKAPQNPKERIEFVAAFVQGSVPYVSDGEGEYPKYPIETMVEGGDCEDKSILLAALLRAMGYKTALLDIKSVLFMNEPTGHIAVGVECLDCQGSYYLKDGIKYLYLESTKPGWLIGEIPNSLDFDSKKYPVVYVIS